MASLGTGLGLERELLLLSRSNLSNCLAIAYILDCQVPQLDPVISVNIQASIQPYLAKGVA